MADAGDSKSPAREGVWVRVPPPVPHKTQETAASVGRLPPSGPDDMFSHSELDAGMQPRCGGSWVEATALPVEETWRLEDLFADLNAYEAAVDDFAATIEPLTRFEGRLLDSAQALADALELVTESQQQLRRLYTYASLLSDRDTADGEARGRQQDVELLSTRLSKTVSFIRPELLAAAPQRIEAFVAEESRLAPHRHFLRDLIRQRDHVLSPPEERILAEAGLLTRDSNALYVILNNVEIPRPELELPDASTVQVDPVQFAKLRLSPDRQVRRRAFDAFFGSYGGFRETLAQVLSSSVKSNLFRARCRRYSSCLAAAMAPDNIPTAVYENLIRQVRQRLPILHRYFELRRRALGVDRLAYWDLHCPVTGGPVRSYEVDDAVDLVVEATAPLGAKYVETLRGAFDSRWVDWHPGKGKRSGAYSNGWAYDVHPYVLMNFLGDQDGVSTLAHEMGHAMHSHFSNREQPFASSSYSIFVAEVASTLNEALLDRLQLERASSDDERLFLLATQLDGLRATLFRQTMFAEFELRIHQCVEAGENLSGAALDRIYLNLLREYHGHDEGIVDIDERAAIEWASVPHFHFNFYVYQYATGIVASESLARQVVEQGQPAQERILQFLSAGGSDYPLEVLRRAGVDLESRTPYDDTFSGMERRLDAMEALL